MERDREKEHHISKWWQVVKCLAQFHTSEHKCRDAERGQESRASWENATQPQSITQHIFGML